MNYLAASGEVSCHTRTFLSGIHKSKGSRPSSGQIPAENMPRRGPSDGNDNAASGGESNPVEIERMLKSVILKGGKVKACGTCADARGIRNLQLIEGAEISNMSELAKWTVESDKVFTF